MMNDDSSQTLVNRYVRQTVYAPLGVEGQRRLAAGQVLICGCGALGSTLANMLGRAGVGRLRIVDRDRVDRHNLHRQSLFDELDAARQAPKAVAAADHLAIVNSEVTIEAIVGEIARDNIERLLEGVDVIVDGTDNFETRYLINDAAVKHGVPWVYGGCVGTRGQMMAIVPGRTPCLRCLWPECPAPGSVPTCPTHGILGPTVGVIASLEAMEAIKLLAGAAEAVSPVLTVIELWENRIRQVDLAGLRAGSECPTCKQGRFDWLEPCDHL
ncbi:MAG TPA: ThiF family adenylyltransferase [Thermoguttaceae bacterium]|nr:ThiF family adenylyltransferase [Thermoguttaceae bacterium]